MACFLYAFWPCRWNRYFRQLKIAVVSASRVPASVDPEQSEVSYFGPSGLRVALFITVENYLDAEVRPKKLDLVIKMTKKGQSILVTARPV